MTSTNPPISLRPLLRPGMAVSVYRGYTGTLGGFAVTEQGDVVFLFAEHQLGESRSGDPILLEPHGVKVGVVGRARMRIKRIAGARSRPKPRSFRLPRAGVTHNVNMRYRGLAEGLPVVLKSPVIPEVGRLCVKTGFATDVTYGKVMHIEWSLPVELPDGTFAYFRDQILTEPMGKGGDSGSILFTADTFEPVGLLSSGNEFGTYFSKLTRIAEEGSLKGIFSPISLPSKASVELRYIVSCILPDGFFAQTSNIQQKDPAQVLEELGVREISRELSGGFSVLYDDLIMTSNPHLPGDEGSIMTTKDHALIGLGVAGDKEKTLVIPASHVIKALNLELVELSAEGWRMLHGAGYARKFCDNCKVSLYPDTLECPFCGRQVYWGAERIQHFLRENA